MKSLIIGKGEIGSSLLTVLSKKYETKIIDKGESFDEEFEVLHVCFPYSKQFVKYVKGYMLTYRPKYVVIHSTVPIGTTKKFGNNVVHSPVRGKHPDLAESLTTFVKYIGSNNVTIGEELAFYFVNAGINIKMVSGSDNTEAGKILSTTYYGWTIVFMQLVYNYCQELGLDFDIVYTHFNETYNKGYDAMSEAEFSKFHRPVLDYTGEGIGGHCVWENADMMLTYGEDSELLGRIFHTIKSAGKPEGAKGLKF